MKYENENTEFKVQATDELYKEVVAFANTEGGVVYVGVDDVGNVIGLDRVDEVYTRVTNGIRDAILPDVTMFVKYTLGEDRTLRIQVSEGSSKPYYLKAKGLKPSGVFVRQGASSAQASFEQIRTMIKESDGDQFEDMRSVEQQLTFDRAKQAFERYGVELAPNKYRALGLTSREGEIFSNLALILSDQCAHTVKIAVFADEANTAFRDSKEFGGSVFDQLEGAYSYLTLCNKTKATFEGLVRIERSDYPAEALREALLNALVHRDYSFSGSTIINVNEREIEFISLGGLLPGLSPEDIRSGISQPRNKNLAAIFHRLHLIEAYGTGIRRIFHLYRDCPDQPRITVTANTFKITLPNMNRMASADTGNEMSEQVKRILDDLNQKGRITDEEIMTLLGLRKTRVYELVKQMRQAGLIRAVGRGSKKVYVKA